MALALAINSLFGAISYTCHDIPASKIWMFYICLEIIYNLLNFNTLGSVFAQTNQYTTTLAKIYLFLVLVCNSSTKSYSFQFYVWLSNRNKWTIINDFYSITKWITRFHHFVASIMCQHPHPNVRFTFICLSCLLILAFVISSILSLLLFNMIFLIILTKVLSFLLCHSFE